MAPWSVLDAIEIVASSRDEPGALVQMLDKITLTARDTIPGTDYASVIVWYPDDHLESFAPTHRVITAIDRLQCTLQEGPCFDAVTRSQVVASGNLGHDDRWPAYGVQAAAFGIRSQLSMVVHDGRRARVGLNLYSRDQRAFRHPLAAAGVLTQYAGGLLSSLGDLRRLRGMVDAVASGVTRAFPEVAPSGSLGADTCRASLRGGPRRPRARGWNADSGGHPSHRRS